MSQTAKEAPRMPIETLIELYDDRPLENVLGVEMFRPQRVVYIRLCY